MTSRKIESHYKMLEILFCYISKPKYVLYNGILFLTAYFFELQNRTNGVNGICILIFSCIFIVHKLIGRSNAYQYHLQIQN